MKKLNSFLLLVMVVVLLSGCSLLQGNNVPGNSCNPTYTSTTHATLAKITQNEAGEPVKLLGDSWVYTYKTAPASLKDEMKCILADFKTELKSGHIYMVTFVVEDTNTIFHYSLDVDENILMEMKVAKVEDDYYLAYTTVYTPLNNALELLAGEKKKKVFLLGQEQGLVSREDFDSLMSVLVNGTLPPTE